MRIRKIETGARSSAEIGRSSAELSKLAEQGEGSLGAGEAEDAYQAGAAREGEEEAAHLGDHRLRCGEMWGRCGGDVGRCGGDVGEMWGRCTWERYGRGMREVWARYGRGMGEGYLGLCELELELLHTLLLSRRAREQRLRLG